LKQGRTLQELAQEIERQNGAKRDLLVGTEALALIGDDGNRMALNIGVPAPEQFGINDVAHRQISQHLGIPQKYYDKMRTDYPELLMENVNGWFGKTPSTRMVRTLDGTARAFLSDRYRRIDNHEVAMTVLPLIGGIQGATIESCELTDSRMYLKVVNPRLTAEVRKGDIVQSGILISNSEVGMGSVNVAPLVYRLVCSNGMVAADSRVRKYHVGRVNESDEGYGIYRDETIAADDRAFLMKVSDTVRAVVEQRVFEQIVTKMRDAADAKIDGKVVPQVVELAAKEYSITEAEGESVLGYLIDGGDLSLYGLANAVTRHAQDVESYDRSTELEAIGYRVLTMPPALWRRINAA